MSIKVYTNPDFEMTIQYFPSNFYVYDLGGDKENGSIEFWSEEIIDDYWGSYITFEFSWEREPFDERDSDGDLMDQIDVHVSKIGLQRIDRVQKYIQSNFLQYVVGGRIKHVKNKAYPVVEIHGVWYSAYSERIINFTFKILREIYGDWKNILVQLIESVRFYIM